jgi:hypothetical protein
LVEALGFFALLLSFLTGGSELSSSATGGSGRVSAACASLLGSGAAVLRAVFFCFSSGAVAPNERACGGWNCARAAQSRQTGRLRHDEACRRCRRRSIERRRRGKARTVMASRDSNGVGCACSKIMSVFQVQFADGL